MATDKRQLLLEILGKDSSSQASASAARGLDSVADAADDAGEATEKFGRSQRTAGEHVESLDREIENVERELRQMAVAFTEAQTAAERMDLDKAMRRTSAQLRGLNKNRGILAGLLPSPGEVAEAGADVGKGLGRTIGSGLAAAGPQIKVALIGAAVLAAPFIGATISSAVIAGVGAGAVAGGITLAAKDPRVASASKALGAKLLSNLKDDAEPFIAPLLLQVDKVGDRFETLRPRLRSIFANSSQFLDPLTDGVLDMLDGILAGVDRVVAKSGPVMDSLGAGLARLGDDIGYTLAIIGDDAENAASALDLLFRIIGEVTTNVGRLIRGLTETYGVMDRFGSSVNDTVRGWLGFEDANKRVTGSGSFAADAISGLADKSVLLGMKAQGASGEIVTLSREINDLAEAGRNAFDVATDVGAALDAVTEAARKNGATHSVATEKGRENRQVLSQLRDALIAEYNAMVAVNGEGEQANSVASRNRDRFIAAARAFGYSAQEAERLATEMGLIPSRKTITISDNFPAARARARGIQAELNRMPRTIPVRVIVSRQGDISYGGGGGRQAPMREMGGPVKANQAYVVGEKRAEVFVPDRDGRIIPSIDEYLGGAAAAGPATRRSAMPAGAPQAVLVGIDPGGALDELERMFLKMLRVRPAFAATVRQYVNSAG